MEKLQTYWQNNVFSHCVITILRFELELKLCKDERFERIKDNFHTWFWLYFRKPWNGWLFTGLFSQVQTFTWIEIEIELESNNQKMNKTIFTIYGFLRSYLSSAQIVLHMVQNFCIVQSNYSITWSIKCFSKIIRICKTVQL